MCSIFHQPRMIARGKFREKEKSARKCPHGAPESSARGSPQPSSSLKPDSKRALIASAAACSSAPSAMILILEPKLAARVMIPMIDLALILLPDFSRKILEANFTAVWAISAEGRAWMPALFFIVVSSSTMASLRFSGSVVVAGEV